MWLIVRSVITSLVIAIGLLIASTTHAAVVAYNFQVTGFAEGASISGMFTGEDASEDGLLEYSELSDFMLDWSGNSLIPAFSHTFANLAQTFTSTTAFDFSFDIGSVDLRSFASCAALGPNDCTRPAAFRASGASVFGVQDPFDSFDSSSIQNATYMAKSVPEPTTLLLLGLGLAGLGFARKRLH